MAKLTGPFKNRLCDLVTTAKNMVLLRKGKPSGDTVTDEIFLAIQNNHELMQCYLRLVDQCGLHNINKNIGKEIKKQFSLRNKPLRSNKPASTLISSHQKFF